MDAQVWDEQAEHLAESLHKSDRVLVIGRWVTRFFTPIHGPNEGVEQRRLDMVVDEVGPSLAWATAVVTKPAPLLTASRPTEHRVWAATSSPTSEGAVTSVMYAA